jgi:CO/xanthine dehydrogenase FAD-binding subunit
MVNVYRPLNLMDALTIRISEHVHVLAGGTDFMVKRRRLSPDDRPVLCISQLKELRQIVRNRDELCIGAACTLSELLMSPLLPDYLKRPISEMASPAIRNIATIGGNLCNASPAGDALPMLYALDAVLYLQSVAGQEVVAVQDFILAPGKTQLGDEQLLTEIRIPLLRDWHCTYRKVGTRCANSLSKLSFYAIADRSAQCLRDIRIAFGAVAPTVVRCREAEQAILYGIHLPTVDYLQQITAYYDGLLKPIDDVRSSHTYRRAVSLRLLKQYLMEEISA